MKTFAPFMSYNYFYTYFMFMYITQLYFTFYVLYLAQMGLYLMKSQPCGRPIIVFLFVYKFE